MSVLYWNENRKILGFLPQNHFSGVILCGELIVRIPEAWKCFPDHDSEKWVFCVEAKIEKSWVSCLKIIFLGVILCEELIARILEAWKCFLDPDSGKLVHVRFSIQSYSYFPESELGKRFQALEMRAINFPRNMILRRKFFDFRFNIHIYFP